MNYISRLINQYLKHRHAPGTEAKIQQWLTDEDHAVEKDHALRAYWDSITAGAGKDARQALARAKSRLGMDAPAKVVPLPRKLLRVAAVLLPLLLVAGGYLYMNRNISTITVTAQYGERKQITLPDSSKVWLNAGSRLAYPERFARTRTMQLSGDAYFAVTKDPSKPFIVQTEQLSVQALGTEFGVTAYAGEDKTTTALVTGKIQVALQDGTSYVLTPGEQLSFNHDTRKAAVGRTDTADVIARRNGGLIFDNATLAEMIRTVERHYNLSISINAPSTGSPDDRFSVKFSGREPIEQLMNVLQDLAGDFSWTATPNNN